MIRLSICAPKRPPLPPDSANSRRASPSPRADSSAQLGGLGEADGHGGGYGDERIDCPPGGNQARQKHVPRSPSEVSHSFCALRDTPDARAASSSELEPQRARALQRSTDALFLKEVPGPVLRASLVAELWVRHGRTDSRNSVASKRAWPQGSVSDAGRARSPTETFGARG